MFTNHTQSVAGELSDKTQVLNQHCGLIHADKPST